MTELRVSLFSLTIFFPLRSLGKMIFCHFGDEIQNLTHKDGLKLFKLYIS